ncbi:lipopolysaccharide biosynthesis protein [Kaistia terrae]|uniref:Lipopolysaccharide biosynthesis protein n=1 Tax=Kaistia terrae TaxID=537017 RepID=A0ABW0Q1M1_9HYPH|nr:lipopolysaccharide biosynthesis protein [Kaistia terrae]MCX5578587.1 lipopolysaccharide biosynthesis protein [Kaistia terrae]
MADARPDLPVPAALSVNRHLDVSDDPGLHRSVAIGAMWTHGALIAGKLIVLVNTVILARMLLPDDFGLVAISLVILAYMETAASLGSGAAIVWRHDEPEKTAAVALSMGLAGSLLVGGLTFAAAPIFADFFKDGRISEMVRVLSICFLLTSPASIFSSLLQRRMEFRRRAVAEIGKALAKGVVGIGLAAGGLGAWSLVWGHIAGQTFGLALLWWLSGWRPRLSLDRDILRQISRYGSLVALIELLGMATKNIDFLVIGRWFDPSSLGIYVLGFALIDQVVMSVCWAASQALFPAYSRMQRNRDALRRSCRESLAVIAAIALPAAAGIAVVAQPLVLLFFGEKWLPAVPVMQALAFYAMIYALSFNLSDIYKATGRPHILTLIAVANLILAMPILIVATRWGIVGVAFGQVLVALTTTILNWIVVWRVVGIGVDILYQAVRAPLVATALMVVSCLAVDNLGTIGSTPLRLAVLVATGMLVYALALRLFAPQLVEMAIRLAFAESRQDAPQGKASQ